MFSLNKITLIGNTGNAPELQYGNSGNSYARFSLAVTESVKKDGGYEKVTTWFSCTMFGKQAETFSKLIGKGHKIFVEGRLKLEQYEKNGETKNTLSVMVSQIVILDKKETQEPEYREPIEYIPAKEENEIEPLPF